MHGNENIFTEVKTVNAQTITTLEIAEMMNIDHWQVLRKLDGQEKDGKHIKGYIEILTDNEIVVSEDLIQREAREMASAVCDDIYKYYAEFPETLKLIENSILDVQW